MNNFKNQVVQTKVDLRMGIENKEQAEQLMVLSMKARASAGVWQGDRKTEGVKHNLTKDDFSTLSMHVIII